LPGFASVRRPAHNSVVLETAYNRDWKLAFNGRVLNEVRRKEDFSQARHTMEAQGFAVDLLIVLAAGLLSEIACQRVGTIAQQR